MISEIQMPYGSRVRRQGKSRAFARYQRSRKETICLLLTVAENNQEFYAGTTVVKPLSSYTRKLTPEEAARLQNYLQEHSFTFRDVPHARFAATNDRVNVVFYESGKLVVQGKGTEEFVDFVIEPEV